jgi:hypothetical protein
MDVAKLCLDLRGIGLEGLRSSAFAPRSVFSPLPFRSPSIQNCRSTIFPMQASRSRQSIYTVTAPRRSVSPVVTTPGEALHQGIHLIVMAPGKPD